MSTHPDRTRSPQVSLPQGLKMPDAVTMTLEGGIPLTIYDGGDAAVNRLTVLVDGGNFDEPAPGIRKLAADLLIEGAGKYSGNELTDLFDYNGSWQGTAVQTHHTMVQMFSLNDRFEAVLPAFADMVLRPQFPAKAVEVILEKEARRLAIQQQRVSYAAAELFDKQVLGPSHPLARHPQPAQIRRYTRDEIAATWQPKGLRLYVSGRVTDAVLRAIESTFGNIQATPATAFPAVIHAPQYAPAQPGIYRTEIEGALQTGITAGVAYNVGRRDADFVPLRLAVSVLGGYFGSRLMLNIREDKGYTYGIGASLMGYRDGSILQIRCEADPNYVDALLEEMRGEMLRMHRPESYSAEEIKRARSFMLTQLLAQLDSPFSIMDYHIQGTTIGITPDYYSTQLAMLNSMTPESLAATAQRYLLPEQLRIALAGRAH